MTRLIKSIRCRLVAGVSAALALATTAFAGEVQARENVSISLGIAVPGVSVGINNGFNQPYYGPRAVYVQPAPVYVQPQPIYYAPQPYYRGQSYFYPGKRHPNKFRGHGRGHGRHHGEHRGFEDRR